jgi:type I restriction enzyme S subunit
MATDSLVGSVPDEWEVTTLGVLVKRGGGFIQTGPFGSQLHSSDYVETGIPAIMPVNIGENRVDVSNIARIKSEDASRLSRYLVQAGDIVYSRRGDIERRALISEHEEGWLCGTGCLMVRLGEKSPVEPTYASYYLGHPSVRRWLVQHAIGATMPNLNTSIMQALPFVVPSRDEQLSVTAILAALDEKIDLNDRMNRTLVAVARAIFKAWFTDLAPVHAKRAGATAFPGMPQQVFERLTAEISDTPRGPLPNGWQNAPVGQVVRVLGGNTPSTKDRGFWEDGEHAFCTPRDLSKLKSPVLLDTERHLTQSGVERISSGQLPTGTVLLSSRAPIGYLAISETPVSVNQGIIAMHSATVPSSYLWFWAEANMPVIESRAGGSTFAEISKASFREISFLRPDDSLLAAFGDIAEPILRLITANERESAVLAAIRDALLPELVSGSGRVGPAGERASG